MVYFACLLKHIYSTDTFTQDIVVCPECTIGVYKSAYCACIIKIMPPIMLINYAGI